MKVIPSIDIIENQVVRLEKGDYEKMQIYSDSVLETAITFEKYKFSRIHIVDLLGSKTGKLNVEKEIIEIKKNTNLEIQFGGGIRNFNDAEKLLKLGSDKIVVGSLPVKNYPEFEKIVNEFSPEKIIVAADVKEGKIAVKGWTEKSELSVDELLEKCKSIGITEYLITDISRDGMLTGPATELYTKLMKAHPEIDIIASGGVSGIEDLKELEKRNIYGSVVGRAIYENKISLEEMKNCFVKE